MVKFVIRKDVYEELIQKGFGKKDYGKLQKVQRPDKNGVMRTIYVNPNEEIENEEQMGKQEVKRKKKKTKKTTKGIDYETAKQAMKEGKEVQWYDEDRKEWNTVEPGTSELVMARDIGVELRIKPSSKYSEGQEVSFEYGGNAINGKVTAIGELGVTVKDANGKIYKVNYDEIKK